MITSASELEVLMRRMASGDRAAFAAIYTATSSKLYGIVLRILKRSALADEVLQETYVRIWSHAASFDPARASPISWMAAIARNRALDEVRKQTTISSNDLPGLFEIRDPALLPSEQLEIAADYSRLKLCLEALDPEKRDIVKLAYLEGQTREELGRQFGHPVSTIKTWLHRSLKQLKACLSS